jgi:hypothetical protein
LGLKLDAAWRQADDNDEDYTSVGWCDLCSYYNIHDDAYKDCRRNKYTRYGCATAYLIRPSFAAALGRTDFCMAADVIFQVSCSFDAEKWQWITEYDLLQERLEPNLPLNASGLPRHPNCAWIEEPPIKRGSAYRGLFQQDVVKYGGSHSATAADEGLDLNNDDDVEQKLQDEEQLEGLNGDVADADIASGYEELAGYSSGLDGGDFASAFAEGTSGELNEGFDEFDGPESARRGRRGRRGRIDSH